MTMRLTIDHHKQHSWRVHDLLDDFELDEVWAYPITADPSASEDFAMFVDMMSNSDEPGGITGLLFKLRLFLGRIFGWDDEDKALPIPGCDETSLRERLSEDERKRVEGIAPDPLGFQLVYHSENERFVELSNSTVHAVLHMGWVPRDDGMAGAEMAVYWKPRGWFGPLYMAFIKPFRVYIVYPGLMKQVATNWASFRAVAQGSPTDG
jgi:hypothetical protein